MLLIRDALTHECGNRRVRKEFRLRLLASTGNGATSALSEGVEG
jgi:hypothetical protein